MRAEKQFLLDEIKDKIEKSSAFVVTKYQGLKANPSAEFRKLILSNGGDFEIVRKRILIKAAEAVGIKLHFKELGGHIGVIFAYEDAVNVTKTAYKYSNDHADVLEFLLGRFEGQQCSKEDLKKISELPSKDQMRSQILGLLEAVPAGFLATFEALLTSVPHCLENKAKQSGE